MIFRFDRHKGSVSYTFLDYIYFRHQANWLQKLIFEWLVSSYLTHTSSNPQDHSNRLASWWNSRKQRFPASIGTKSHKAHFHTFAWTDRENWPDELNTVRKRSSEHSTTCFSTPFLWMRLFLRCSSRSFVLFSFSLSLFSLSLFHFPRSGLSDAERSGDHWRNRQIKTKSSPID